MKDMSRQKNQSRTNSKKEENHLMESKAIGNSEMGRPLEVEFFGDADSDFRIFVIAGQHGDEKYSILALEKLRNYLNRNKDDNVICSSASIALLYDANPDGSFKNTRTNTNSVDPNRDHQLLQSSEIYAIHRFVRSWRPNLIIDVHNFPPRREHLLAKDLIIDYDVFVGFATNPVIKSQSNKVQQTLLLKKIKSTLKSHGFTCEEYIIIKKTGQARPSTLDIQDARNSLALRYNSFTVLIEGKEPRGKKDQKKIVSAQYHAIRSTLKWAVKHKDSLKIKKTIPVKGDLIPIRYQYKKSQSSFSMKFKNAITEKVELVKLIGYTPDIMITRFVKLPLCYAIHSDCQTIIDILYRHGFKSESKKYSSQKNLKCYNLWPNNIVSKNIHNLDDDSSIPSQDVSLGDYVIFSTTQQGGQCLALFLETESRYNLYRYEKIGDEITSLSPKLNDQDCSVIMRLM